MAVFNIVLPFSLITWGERYIDSSLAAILQATTPLFTIVIASLALAEEAITLNRLVGLIVGFGGVVVLFSHGLSGGSTSSLPGEIALVLSSVSYAAGNVFVRLRMRGFHPTVPAFFQVSFALLITSVLALVLESPIHLPDTPRALFAIVWLGVFGSSLAYLIYFRLVHVLGPTRMSLITYVMPIVGIVLGMLVLNETIDLRTIAGTAVILAGVGLVNSRRGARRVFGRAAEPKAAKIPAEAPPA
jgi:drug/metabolite transporter (DMT)-like permease